MQVWVDIVRFARVGDWSMAGYVFGEMVMWGELNALRSHDERPWSALARYRMLSALYPSEFPF
jgi:hypothetical protein